ncbi:MAG: apolipoprotein N-acyltransferase [Gemmatales bacterium]|nr:apolipoprotein N-acyltransferase [Gemmatales bacterium]MDW8223359.1 apolipoprotein N-acyltransferase [Gemmatales bacterium]
MDYLLIGIGLLLVGCGGLAARKPPLPQGTLSPRSTWLLPLISAVLLWCSYFPLDWGELAWVALVPWLVVLRCSAFRRYAASFVAGWAFGFLALQWMRYAHPLMYGAWWALALVMALHWWVLALVTDGLLRARVPWTWSAPAVWVSLEWLRANVDIGFSWYFLAHTQHDYLPYLGLVPITGAYGVSALVMLVNAVMAEALVRLFYGRARPQEVAPPSWVGRVWSSHGYLVLQMIGCLALLAANPLLARRWRQEFPPQGAVSVVIVQPNEPQDVRNASIEERQQQSMEQFKELLRQARDLSQGGSVALVVWPETSMPFDWVEIRAAEETTGVTPTEQLSSAEKNNGWGNSPGEKSESDEPEEIQQARIGQRLAQTITRELARLVPTWMLLGVNTRIYYWVRDVRGAQDESPSGRVRVVRYNSALLLDPQGQVAGRYDKIYRIPFGEYLPLRSWLPWVEWFSPYSYEYSIMPGSAAHTLQLGPSGKRFAVLICYEDTVPHLPRQFFRPGGAPDFFVNISNDGWFHGSEEHEQHLAIARFRAAETRRALIRSVNMGISAVIDGNGAVLALPLRSWSESKSRAAVFVAELPIYTGTTVYVRWNDWFVWALWVLTAIWLLALSAVPMWKLIRKKIRGVPTKQFRVPKVMAL